LTLGPGKERKKGFSRWSRTLFEFKRAPMTVVWGVQDPVAVTGIGRDMALRDRNRACPGVRIA